jgi:mannose/fructose/sorbose-specific phosphotransferase system IIA component
LSKVGLVLAAHGDLAQSFLESASLIVGEVEGAVAVNLDPSMNLESMTESMAAACEQADQGSGVLILLDLFGGTPSNSAAMALQNREGEAITGLNLPMLLEVAMQREVLDSAGELAALAKSAGNAGVQDVMAAFRAVSAASDQTMEVEPNGE